MTSKSVRSVKLVVKDGKTRLVRKSTLFTGPKKGNYIPDIGRKRPHFLPGQAGDGVSPEMEGRHG